MDLDTWIIVDRAPVTGNQNGGGCSEHGRSCIQRMFEKGDRDDFDNCVAVTWRMPFANAHSRASDLRKLHFASRAYSFKVLLYLTIKAVVVAVSIKKDESRMRSKPVLLHHVCRLQMPML